jgi:hypothetical protein
MNEEQIHAIERHTRQMKELATAAQEFKAAYHKLRHWIRDDQKPVLDKAFMIVFTVLEHETKRHREQVKKETNLDE